MNNIIDKINRTRVTLKKILSYEWDTEKIPDLSNQEVEKLYSLIDHDSIGHAGGCNFSISHKKIPSYKLHVIYFNFPEIGRLNSKITRSAVDKIYSLYETGTINKEDSLFIIINDNVSETLNKSFQELNIKLQSSLNEVPLSPTIIQEMKKNNHVLENRHFSNVHVFNINSLTNNFMKHVLVKPHIPIRKKEDINQILELCRCDFNQLPVIRSDDPQAKFNRIVGGDICKIIRGENIIYRGCHDL